MKLYKFHVSVYTPFAQLRTDIDKTDDELFFAMWDGWTSVSKVIGDFTCVNSLYRVSKRSVYNELSSNFSGLFSKELSWQKNPKELTAKNPKRLKWLPVEKDVDMVAFYTNIEVPILPESTFEDRIYNGKILGKDLVGIETRNGRGEGEIITPRVEGQGLFISSHDVIQADFFHPVGRGDFLCKPCVKEFCEQKGYSNIQFLEYGEIV